MRREWSPEELSSRGCCSARTGRWWATSLVRTRGRDDRSSTTGSRSGLRSVSASSPVAMRTRSPHGWPRRCARSSCAIHSCARPCWCAAGWSGSSHRAGGPDHRLGAGGVRATVLRPDALAPGPSLRGSAGAPGRRQRRRVSVRASAAGRAQGRPGSSRVGDPAARGRQAGRGAGVGSTGTVVHRREREASRGVAGPGDPLLPLGPARGVTAGPADVAGRAASCGPRRSPMRWWSC
jgi:hypothetical protein